MFEELLNLRCLWRSSLIGTIALVSLSACAPAPPISNKSAVTELLDLHNHYRENGAPCMTQGGLPTLKLNPILTQVAAAQAQRMAKEKRLKHGDQLGTRMSHAGYEYKLAAENIAFTLASGEPLIQLWLNSDRHCDNIMNTSLTDVGIASQDDYWAVILASPK